MNYYGSITNCYATSAVSGGGESDYVGGLCGYNFGSVTCCYAIGTVTGDGGVGGLVGYNRGTLTTCYATGSVSGDWSVGGLVGYNSSGSIAGSFWDTETSGQTTSYGGTGKTTAEMQSINTFLAAGWDFVNETSNGTSNYWHMPQDDYPELSAFAGYIPPEPVGSGTANDPYVIADANDLGTVWYRPSGYYVLGSDINLAEIGWSTPVVPVFSGVLDGGEFCIGNLSISGEGYNWLVRSC